MNTLYESLKSNNELLEAVDPNGWRGRSSPSDLAYARFLDHVRKDQRDVDLVLVAMDLHYVHQLLHVDLGVFGKKLTEDQEKRCSGMIASLTRLGLMVLLTNDAKKTVLAKIKKLSACDLL